MLCLIKGQSGFVSLAEYPISTLVPLDLSSASSSVSASIVFLPDIQLLNIQQVLTILLETILLLHVEVFQSTFFGKKIYRILNFNMKYSAADSGPVWLGFSCGISIIHRVCHPCEQ